jgi:hypothetical protein
MILDCETATMPYASNFEPETKKKIAIAKPLIYDFAWKVVDRYGNEYSKHSYIITEIFSVPSVFNTAYFAHKRPQYINKLNNGEIALVNWDTAMNNFLHDLAVVESVGAYNSMFDYKKAIPFTELYIRMLYSENYQQWEQMQNKFIDKIATEKPSKPSRDFDEMHFEFRGQKYPMFDLWGLSCQHLLNNDNFREMANCYGWHTGSGKYYSTTAETTYRFLHNAVEFEESHTALEDVNIETEIFAEIVKRSKNKYEMGIIFFPFRIVGRVEM